MKSAHWYFVIVATVVALLPARAALASPDYPAVLEETLQMPCAPQCTVCHRDNNGGLGTVVQPFGNAMRFEGDLQ